MVAVTALEAELLPLLFVYFVTLLSALRSSAGIAPIMRPEVVDLLVPQILFLMYESSHPPELVLLVFMRNAAEEPVLRYCPSVKQMSVPPERAVFASWKWIRPEPSRPEL